MLAAAIILIIDLDRPARRPDPGEPAEHGRTAAEPGQRGSMKRRRFRRRPLSLKVPASI